MNEDDKKPESEATPEGAVEVQEEDLDKAAGGAIYMKTPLPEKEYDLKTGVDPLVRPATETLTPTDPTWDLKKI